MTALTQQIEYVPFETNVLERKLALSRPQFASADDAFRQLQYVEKYAGDLNCRSIVVEQRYVDRDYMEDHSVFYSKSLFPYPNYCRRVHFFSLECDLVRQQLRNLVALGGKQGDQVYREACRNFSENAYLGFAIIRPLQGSPVGRTVMRHFPESAGDEGNRARREFGGARHYSAHLLGVELTVHGLAFQQQDIGVSACATTAIWSALQKIRDHEDIAAFTPAQITLLASKYSLPFGRAMPSEGLSLDQMCQAIQAVGVSPNVFRLIGMTEAAGYLHAVIRSGAVPVLVLQSTNNLRHAVAAVGMKVRDPLIANVIAPAIDDTAGNVMALYIHDDRYGPYLLANLVTNPRNGPSLSIPLRDNGGTESWDLTHLLVPMHAKVRLSFAGLREVALKVVRSINSFREAIIDPASQSRFSGRPVTFDNWIMRADRYIESLFMGRLDIPSGRVEALCEQVVLARYVGVVRVRSSYFKTIDVLVDTTGTLRNTQTLAVIAREAPNDMTTRIARFIATEYQCGWFD